MNGPVYRGNEHRQALTAFRLSVGSQLLKLLLGVLMARLSGYARPASGLKSPTQVLDQLELTCLNWVIVAISMTRGKCYY